MSKTFEDLWKFVVKRSSSFPVVQEYNELAYVFNLLRGCKSYLEVGTAEGNSLYIRSHALDVGAHITYIDWDENHTRVPRQEVVTMIGASGKTVRPIHANTMSHDAILAAAESRYDVVLIDAGHSYEEALSDAMNYGKLADKYIIFHDICLKPVEEAFEEYRKLTGHTAYSVVNSETFGYGVLQVR